MGRASEDLWRPQVATDGANKPWLIWSQQERGNWDIYGQRLDGTGVPSWTANGVSPGGYRKCEPVCSAAAIFMRKANRR